MTLEPADLLLWRITSEASWFDRLIGWAERRLGEQRGDASYYHVSFVSADVQRMYQSKPPRISLSLVPNPLPSYVEVYRLKVGIAPFGLTRIFNYADSRLGKRYDWLGVLTAGWMEVGGLEFCSQFTEDAYMQYPVTLCPDVRFTTPDDLAASPLLERVL